MTSGSLDTTVTSVAHYDRLLQQINELQSDLGRTLSVAQSLRSENDSLRAGYEKVCSCHMLRNLVGVVQPLLEPGVHR